MAMGVPNGESEPHQLALPRPLNVVAKPYEECSTYKIQAKLLTSCCEIKTYQIAMISLASTPAVT